MRELLKDKYYNYNFISEIAMKIKTVYPSFQMDVFIHRVLDDPWKELELKERMRKISLSLGEFLPGDYKKNLEILNKVVASYPEGFNSPSLLCFPDFVEVFGMKECYWNLSIKALELYTSSSSSEFAIRAFILKDQERTMKQMNLWAKDPNFHVRRLASEGCRPSLPWGQSLLAFKKDPSPILNILEQLKEDPSLYVRKSVANNLNDISKTQPELVLDIAKNWYGKHHYTDWIVKHGCRTLLKQGNQEILSILGYEENHSIDVKAFALQSTSVPIGENLVFSFKISVKETTKLRIEYAIKYLKSNGNHHEKIFKISEILLKTNSEKEYIKQHSFANLSTRKHYAGNHSIILIVNGIKQAELDFQVFK